MYSAYKQQRKRKLGLLKHPNILQKCIIYVFIVVNGNFQNLICCTHYDIFHNYELLSWTFLQNQLIRTYKSICKPTPQTTAITKYSLLSTMDKSNLPTLFYFTHTSIMHSYELLNLPLTNN